MTQDGQRQSERQSDRQRPDNGHEASTTTHSVILGAQPSKVQAPTAYYLFDFSRRPDSRGLTPVQGFEEGEAPSTGSGYKVGGDFGVEHRRGDRQFAQRSEVHEIEKKKQEFGGADAKIAERRQDGRVERGKW